MQSTWYCILDAVQTTECVQWLSYPSPPSLHLLCPAHVLQKHGAGAMSMGIIYASVVLASPVGPHLVHSLGPRNCVMLSIVGYLQFVFANFSTSMYAPRCTLPKHFPHAHELPIELHCTAPYCAVLFIALMCCTVLYLCQPQHLRVRPLVHTPQCTPLKH